jgi:transcriptional regulator with XRE-family HTH domain
MNYRIKELRKKHRDTLKDLASKLNYDSSNLSKIERGMYEPSIGLLRKVAEIYNVNMNYFFPEHNGYSSEETNFMGELDICREELVKKYNLMLDGKKLSQTELELVINIIRKLRITIDEYKSED